MEQLKKKESTVFQNKMTYVVYHLFNSFGLSEKPQLLFDKEKPDQLKLPKYIGACEKRFSKTINIITKPKNDGLKTNINGREITLDNAESLLKGIRSGKSLKKNTTILLMMWMPHYRIQCSQKVKIKWYKFCHS